MDNVSIIIPFYNSKEYLNSLFKCISNLELDENDEIILIDNGSKDGSDKICFSFKNKTSLNIKYYYFNEKNGSYAARNYGVSKSKNSILVFTDSDCLPNNNWIVQLKKMIRDNMVVAGRIVINVENNYNLEGNEIINGKRYIHIRN